MGEHQTSPPPPYSGYSPEWMFCAYAGTASSTCRPSVNSLVPAYAGISSLVMVVIASSVGEPFAPAGRSRLTRVWKATGSRPERVLNVSVRMRASVSFCPSSDVRWMSPAA